MLNVREFYCLLSPVDDDDDVQEQQPCLYQCDDHQLHPGDSQSSSPVRCFPDNWIQSVLSSISEAAPNNVYHNTRKEDKIDSFINLEFREIWRNSLVMFRYEEEVVQISSPSPPPLVIRYPTINITKCNICSIANVPKPQKYPILGCSADPEFYMFSRGYVWDGTDDSSDWVLHAVKPKDGCSASRRSGHPFSSRVRG